MEQFNNSDQYFDPDLRILELALQLYQHQLGYPSEDYNGMMTPTMTTTSSPMMMSPPEPYKLQAYGEGRPGKRSTVTEYVPVPTSEHVAEIIGRQGCKIKELRAKTRAYIKTPERGEEPVFIVTGKKDDVELARHEILAAAEHFSRIRALRKHEPLPIPAPSVSGLMTVQIRVPYSVVGLVVGPKGSTIKNIQQKTNTYIVTPSREKEPVFEVTGLADNVRWAQSEIESHIVVRTGHNSGGPSSSDSDPPSPGGGIAEEAELLTNWIHNGGSSAGNSSPLFGPHEGYASSLGSNDEGISASSSSGLGYFNSVSSSLSNLSSQGLGGFFPYESLSNVERKGSISDRSGGSLSDDGSSGIALSSLKY